MSKKTDIDRLQTISSTYWAACTNSYLASGEYYDAQERALRRLLPELGSISTAVDIGCGDGRYTRAIKDFANEVLGIDISLALTEKAIILSSERSDASALRFACVDLNVWRPDRSFDLVSCLGVTSALIGAEHFSAFAALLNAISKPGGLLLLKDTLSLGDDRIAQTGDYVAIYRAEASYLAHFDAHGFKLERCEELMRLPDTVNQLMQFRKI